MMQRDSVPQNYQYSATIGYGYGAPTNISEGAFIKSHAAPPAPRSRSGRNDERTSESSSSASRSAGSSSEPQQPQSQVGALISFSDVEEEMPITKLRGLAERWALSDGARLRLPASSVRRLHLAEEAVRRVQPGSNDRVRPSHVNGHVYLYPENEADTVCAGSVTRRPCALARSLVVAGRNRRKSLPAQGSNERKHSWERNVAAECQSWTRGRSVKSTRQPTMAVTSRSSRSPTLQVLCFPRHTHYPPGSQKIAAFIPPKEEPS
jgi:hypothetical protein